MKIALVFTVLFSCCDLLLVVVEFGIVVIWFPWRRIHQCTHWRQLRHLEVVGCCKTETGTSDSLWSVYKHVLASSSVHIWLLII